MLLLQEGARNECMVTDIAKNTYQNITGEKLRLVQFLLRREQSFEKNDQHLSASIQVRYSHRFRNAADFPCVPPVNAQNPG